MKFVFALIVVAICVMYMHAPGMQAKPSPGSASAGREHGDKANKEQTGEPPAEKKEETGEANHGGETQSDTERKKRAATDPKKIKEWDSINICYSFSPASYGAVEKKGKALSVLVKAAADEWNEKAGINIHLDQGGDDCIQVKDGQGEGCWSWIGYQTKGKNGQSRNEMVLESTKCFTHGVILHELGHAIGLMHEAKRGDSPHYIQINTDNVIKGMESQFTTETDNVGIRSKYPNSDKYDYCSIMHYSSESFSANGKKTIEVPENANVGTAETAEDLESCMGSQIGLSIRDGEGVAKLYGTLDEDSTSKCKYGGYMLKADKQKCRCSNLFTGNTCETPITKGSGCGTLAFDLGEEVEDFKTPKFDNSDPYPVNTHCTWVYTAPAGKKLCVAFPDGYKVEAPAKSGTCAFDYLEIVLDDLLTLKTKRFCGTEKTSMGWYSAFDSNFCAIVFQSDDAYPAVGFKGLVAAIDDKFTGKDADAECRRIIDSKAGSSKAGALPSLLAAPLNNDAYEYYYY